MQYMLKGRNSPRYPTVTESADISVRCVNLKDSVHEVHEIS